MGTARDYYADLELTPSADVTEIRKQFRKLALKYHPDRNPGREEEVNAQFQIIQSAHEVLTDPEQKAKYDASRRTSRYGGASGVKGNPWSNVASQFPPPPRRNPAPGRNPPPPQPTSGAQRWQTRFSAGPPPTAKQATSAETEAKRNAARAFEHMRKPTHTSSHTSSHTTSQSSHHSRPPSSDRSPQKDPRPKNPPPPPPRTEAARQRAQASFGTRKTGYYPRSDGDEQAVPSQNYTPRSYVVPPEPDNTRVPDPLQQFREQLPDGFADNRQRTPYTSHGGEKTNPFDGVPLSRAKSTRDAARNDEHYTSSDDASPRTKPRSSSVPRRNKDRDYGSNLNIPADDDARPRSADEAASPNQGSSYASQPYEQAYGSNPQGGAHEAQTYATPKKPNFAAYATTYRPSGRDELDKSVNKLTAKFFHLSSKQKRPSSERHSKSSAKLLFEEEQEQLLAYLIQNAGTKALHQHVPTPTSTSALQQCETINANQLRPYSFKFAVHDDSGFRATPGSSNISRSSVDDINTQFVKEDASHTWEFNAGENRKNGGESSAVGNDETFGPTSEPSDHPNPEDDQPHERIEEDEAVAGFNARGWSDKFGPQTFEHQPASASQKTVRANSRRKPSTRTTAGTAAIVEEGSSEEDTYEWRGRKGHGQPARVESPQAMDIDSPSPAGFSRSVDPLASEPPHPQSVRNIPVEPTRPEWRPGRTEGIESGSGTPKIDEIEKSQPHVNAVGSEDSEEFRASFADLRNVAPFAPPKPTGLKSFEDLKDNLPFESQPAADAAVRLPKAQPLVFPSAPAAPMLPPTVAIGTIKPTPSSWSSYLADFEDYMRHWDKFNIQVVDHFATRKKHTARTRESKGYGFLGQRSAASVEEYYNCLQQDNDVRQRWNDACMEHEKRFREFMLFRERMK